MRSFFLPDDPRAINLRWVTKLAEALSLSTKGKWIGQRSRLPIERGRGQEFELSQIVLSFEELLRGSLHGYNDALRLNDPKTIKEALDIQVEERQSHYPAKIRDGVRCPKRFTVHVMEVDVICEGVAMAVSWWSIALFEVQAVRSVTSSVHIWISSWQELT